MHARRGQLILIAGMVDDTVGWFLLSIISALAATGLDGVTVLQSAVYLLAIVAFAATAGRLVVRATYRLVQHQPGPDAAVGLTVLLVFLAAAGTQALRLEAVFGAFVTGILIGSYSGVPPAKLAPLRTVVVSVLGLIFFATAGLRMDLTELDEPGVLAAAPLVVVVCAVVGKFGGAYVGAKLSRLNRWEAVALGAGMCSRGIVEVIVAMVRLRLGVLSTAEEEARRATHNAYEAVAVEQR